jgi:hypothetical protein
MIAQYAAEFQRFAQDSHQSVVIDVGNAKRQKNLKVTIDILPQCAIFARFFDKGLFSDRKARPRILCGPVALFLDAEDEQQQKERTSSCVKKGIGCR